ncbi:MAG TPA: hypothetical protein VL943_14525 [Niabella sp.]|nr:hypothetical protein [Niabella sp.]
MESPLDGMTVVGTDIRIYNKHSIRVSVALDAHREDSPASPYLE